ncbi:uncharacterized protein SETTUDRAFT_168657 [Exserohilum turcica Et28A]|uniref:Uncharacterized protein n=1 Tax=Exserohilum turcicum (strain 28A) TaxID=671987 RepID=R0KG70_EXST2|nr:uncharacterized protein SETTUDRAFT_168657 [Exserohilum turcica Et28A]EOA88294.1 hypothetical protein SETTUDRAFT_168657 [Exserohilum turcica Et28A]
MSAPGTALHCALRYQQCVGTASQWAGQPWPGDTLPPSTKPAILSPSFNRCAIAFSFALPPRHRRFPCSSSPPAKPVSIIFC